MTTITEELIRKRAEHNNGEIGSLEEISLHQQDIIKIEHIERWCKDLKIILLQSNLISKIENLGKLKKLQYLNLAINNIERIENLQGCESLCKLDLTLNFIGDLIGSVDSLKNNYNLRELYLTGNPCCKFEGYRNYVMAILPQVDILDGQIVSPCDKIQAKQDYAKLRPLIEKQQNDYKEQRNEQIRRNNLQQTRQQNDQTNVDGSNEVTANGFWNETTENSPEVRLAMAQEIRKNKASSLDLSTVAEWPPVSTRKVQLFKRDGCPLNVNEAKIPFTLDDIDQCYVLTIQLYKHLSTSLLDVDVQPQFVRVLINNKILQLVFDEEVHSTSSTAQRMPASGNLIIRMPKFNANDVIRRERKSPDEEYSHDSHPSQQ